MKPADILSSFSYLFHSISLRKHEHASTADSHIHVLVLAWFLTPGWVLTPVLIHGRLQIGLKALAAAGSWDTLWVLIPKTVLELLSCWAGEMFYESRQMKFGFTWFPPVSLLLVDERKCFSHASWWHCFIINCSPPVFKSWLQNIQKALRSASLSSLGHLLVLGLGVW